MCSSCLCLLPHTGRNQSSLVLAGFPPYSAAAGAHILSGNVLQPTALDELLPGWRDDPDCPVHRQPATAARFYYLTQRRALRLPNPPQMKAKGNYVISLRWVEVAVRVYGQGLCGQGRRALMVYRCWHGQSAAAACCRSALHCPSPLASVNPTCAAARRCGGLGARRRSWGSRSSPGLRARASPTAPAATCTACRCGLGVQGGW